MPTQNVYYGTPVWLTLVVAFGGALLGGVLTLIGGILADRRARFTSRKDKIQNTAFILRKNAALQITLVGEMRRLKSSDQQIEPSKYDEVFAAHRDCTDTIWELIESTEATALSPYAHECLRAWGEVRETQFDESPEAWTTATDGLADAIAKLRTEVGKFVHLSPENANRFLRGKRPRFSK